MYEIKKKVVLITGAAEGIGACIVRDCVEQGVKQVVALDINVEKGRDLAKEINHKYGESKVKFIKCDVTTDDLDAAFEEAIQSFGYIDIVINNAGIMNDSPNVYLKEIAVNVSALISSSLKAYNLMRVDHGGRGGTIINISSIAGLFPAVFMPAYSATKSAVLHFSNCLGMEPHYSRSRVRVITICFGRTDTSLISKSKLEAFDDETNATLLYDISYKIPLQRQESAARGLLEAYKQGTSASTWLVTSNNPAVDITNNVQRAYEIMSQGVFS